MALVQCPDCERKVSDRAKVCPDCSCPVAEVLAELRDAERQTTVAKTREATDRQVDCPRCGARGWYPMGDLVGWCLVCEHTGRASLCKADDGWYAVAPYAVDRFVAAELHPGTSGVVFHLGANEPKGFRFPSASKRFAIDVDDPEIPWEITPDEKS